MPELSSFYNVVLNLPQARAGQDCLLQSEFIATRDQYVLQ